jgi:hypothetical protein
MPSTPASAHALTALAGAEADWLDAHALAEALRRRLREVEAEEAHHAARVVRLRAELRSALDPHAPAARCA